MKRIPAYLKNKAALLTGILLLQNSFVLAAPVQLSLEESISLALRNNPAVQISEADRERSAWGVTEAKSGRYPTVSLNSGYAVNDQSGGLFDGNTNSSIRMDWKMHSDGRVQNQIEQAKLGLTSADLNIEKTKQQLKLDTTTAYYNVLQAGNMVAVGQESVNNLKEHQKVVQAKYEAGIVAKSDILRAEVELANAEQNLIKYNNQHVLAVTNLNNLMNSSADTELELIDALKYEADSRTLEESLQLAKANRPEIAQADVSVRSADVSVKQASSGTLPLITLSAATGLSDGAQRSDDWSVGLTASWNVFDGGSSKAKLKQAQSSRDKAALQSEQVADNVEQEVRQSYLSMREAEKRLETVNVTVDKAKEDLYIAREKYKAGVGTNLDVIDAQLALNQAKTNHVQALYDYNVNRSKLDKAIGSRVN